MWRSEGPPSGKGYISCEIALKAPPVLHQEFVMFQPSTTWIDRFRGQNASQKISNSTILPEASCDEGNVPDFIQQGFYSGW